MPDVEAPGFWDHMERMKEYNLALVAIDGNGSPEWLQAVQRAPYIAGIARESLALFFMPTKRVGSFDIEGAGQYQY